MLCYVKEIEPVVPKVEEPAHSSANPVKRDSYHCGHGVAHVTRDNITQTTKDDACDGDAVL